MGLPSVRTPYRPSAARPEIGLAAMAGAMCIVPVMDAIAKHLALALSPTEIACLRFVFQTALLLPFAALTGRPLRTSHLGLHAARGALIGMALIPLVWSLQVLPLANAIAIFFVEPLILTLMSYVLLGERFGPRRLVAVVVGLVGAMVVIRPNWSEFGAASLLPLVTAVMFAGYLTLTRHSATEEDPVSLQLWAGIFAAIFLTLALVVGGVFGIDVMAPSLPDASQFAWLAGMRSSSAPAYTSTCANAASRAAARSRGARRTASWGSLHCWCARTSPPLADAAPPPRYSPGRVAETAAIRILNNGGVPGLARSLAWA